MLRTDIINQLLAHYNYRKYLEIGIENPSLNFNHIWAPHKLGIDPDPNANANLCLTSDQFFELWDHRMGGFDLIFVDGLHHCEQALKDIDNALELLNPGGTIVVHDCNPSSWSMQEVPRMQETWTGNVWKAWMQFRVRNDLRMFVVDTDYGVGVIQKIRPIHKPLDRVSVMSVLTYKELEANREQWLNLIPPKDGLFLGLLRDPDNDE